jgi:hypothetical protein
MPEWVFFRRGQQLLKLNIERGRTVLGRGALSDIALASIPPGRAAAERPDPAAHARPAKPASASCRPPPDADLPVPDPLSIECHWDNITP